MLFDEPSDQTAFVGQLLLHPLRVEQVQYLRHTGLTHPLAFAGGDAHGPAKEFQEVVIDLTVPQLNRPCSCRRALILLRHTSRLTESTEQDLIDYCREHLAHFKCPTSVERREEIPPNPTGKILKRELRAPYWQGQDREVS